MYKMQAAGNNALVLRHVQYTWIVVAVLIVFGLGVSFYWPALMPKVKFHVARELNIGGGTAFYKRLLSNTEQMWRTVIDAEKLQFKAVTHSILGHNISIFDNGVSWTAPFVANELNNGEYRLLELKKLNWINNDDTVLDLGTNVGITAIMVAKLFPGVRVIGVEAVPHNCAAAKANIERNNVADRVTLLCAALASDTTKPVHIRYSITNPGASSGSEEFYSKGSDDARGHHDFSIAAITVDEILQEFGLYGSHIPFIKLDCEGCEYDIVPKLSTRALKIFKEAFVAGETHSDRMSIPKETADAVHDVYDEFVQGPLSPLKKHANMTTLQARVQG